MMREVDVHVPAAELAWYVSEGLAPELPSDSARLDAVELHIADCEACAARLADEARIELALTEVALPKRRYPAVLATLCAAAVLVLFLLSSASARTRSPAPPEPAAVVPADAGIQLAIDSDVVRAPAVQPD